MNTKTFLSRAICAGLFAGLVGSAPLKAQDQSFRLGAGLSIVSPYGDLADTASLGFGLSVFGEVGIAKTMALRGRVEYALFGEKDLGTFSDWLPSSGIPNSKVTGSANALVLFADYILRFESHDSGLYAFAGLGIVNGTFKIKAEATVLGTNISDTEDLSKSKLGYSAGLGYNISRNLGLEASLTAASGGDDFVDFNWVRVSFKYRF